LGFADGDLHGNAGLKLHPLATRFAAVADAYERGRPEYAPAAVGAMAAELRLGPNALVLDLAAGTGKLTRALVAAGLDVIAVEPQVELREVLAERVGAHRVIEGVAEAIPLDDGAVDAVTVADGFHWFDQPSALAEIRRVLRPGGGLALLATLPDWSGASWADELGELMEEMRPAHPYFDGPPWQEAVRAAGGWTAPREVRVSADRPARPELMADYLGSISWVAAMDAERRRETLKRIDALVSDGETPAEIPVHVIIGLTSLSEAGAQPLRASEIASSRPSIRIGSPPSPS
jgi:SAM-dependent methyltransferase